MTRYVQSRNATVFVRKTDALQMRLLLLAGAKKWMKSAVLWSFIKYVEIVQK